MYITINSGAAESAADPRQFPGYEVVRHPSPIYYQSAAGQAIMNVGEQEVGMMVLSEETCPPWWLVCFSSAPGVGIHFSTELVHYVLFIVFH